MKNNNELDNCNSKIQLNDCGCDVLSHCVKHLYFTFAGSKVLAVALHLIINHVSR